MCISKNEYFYYYRTKVHWSFRFAEHSGVAGSTGRRIKVAGRVCSLRVSQVQAGDREETTFAMNFTWVRLWELERLLRS